MGLFGNDDKQDKKDKKAAENDAMKAEYARLESLSLLQLAEEILVRCYGPGGPGDDGSAPSLTRLCDVLNPARSVFGIDEKVRSAYPGLVSEGVQVLEHARLLVMRFSGGDMSSLGWALTRAGRAALDSGEVAARIGAVLAPGAVQR